MPSRGRGRGGGGRGNNRMPSAFDQQVFMEAISVVTSITAQASVVATTFERTNATEGQGATSNLQGF